MFSFLWPLSYKFLNWLLSASPLISTAWCFLPLMRAGAFMMRLSRNLWRHLLVLRNYHDQVLSSHRCFSIGRDSAIYVQNLKFIFTSRCSPNDWLLHTALWLCLFIRQIILSNREIWHCWVHGWSRGRNLGDVGRSYSGNWPEIFANQVFLIWNFDI